ncbi:MAG: hypothetical protein PHU14_05370 [Methylovulum sp.]|nr:hypothetical protein [Methylovulum sp.]
MRIMIGSPTLTGQDNSAALTAAFAHANYPLAVTVINHTPRNFRHGPLALMLGNGSGGVNTQATLTVTYFRQLQTLCTEATAIAELNGFAQAIEIRVADAPSGATTPAAELSATDAESASPAELAVQPEPEPEVTSEAVPKTAAPDIGTAPLTPSAPADTAPLSTKKVVKNA